MSVVVSSYVIQVFSVLCMSGWYILDIALH